MRLLRSISSIVERVTVEHRLHARQLGVGLEDRALTDPRHVGVIEDGERELAVDTHRGRWWHQRGRVGHSDATPTQTALQLETVTEALAQHRA